MGPNNNTPELWYFIFIILGADVTKSRSSRNVEAIVHEPSPSLMTTLPTMTALNLAQPPHSSPANAPSKLHAST